MKTKLYPMLVLIVLLGLSACDSTDPGEKGAGEEELITRVVVTFTGGGNTVTATANDPDGDGTNLQIDSFTLKAGTTYSGTIQVFNDIDDENITDEIEEEHDQHQFFFVAAGGTANRLSVTATDKDSNNLPVGLSFSVVVSAGGGATGTLQIVLSHFDDSPKDGVHRSDETDIDVTFPVAIE